jgi:hypothetical protein
MFDRECEHLREQTELKFESIRLAYDKAGGILDERLATLNNHKAEMLQLRDTLVTQDTIVDKFETHNREEQVKHDRLREQIASLQKFEAEHRGAASAASVYVGWALSIAALVIGLVAAFR